MGFHILTSTVFDFPKFVARAENDEGPRHTVLQLANTLDAKIHQPEIVDLSLKDKLLGKIYGLPEYWRMARRVLDQASAGDVVFCAGQDVGIPLAYLNKGSQKKLKIAMSSMEPANRRFKLMMKLFGLAEHIDLFIVNDKQKRDFLSDHYAVNKNNILKVPEQTDAQFFNPGEGKLDDGRPIIASAGLEQRDYITLAKSTSNLDLSVRICAFSPNASSGQKVAMPDSIPDNMEVRYYEFSELRDLYRSAAIVVVSLLKNDYSAGLTVLMEAMACKRPVVITKNEGLPVELVEQGIVLGADPGDHDAQRKAIQSLIDDPAFANDLADKAYQHFLQHHTSEVYVDLLANNLRELKG
jgi:glycosyltransferase involved in cell wall biosynthesis